MNQRKNEMIYLIQLLKSFNHNERNDFRLLFSDLSFEIEELGYKGHESDLVNDMLDSHFGITVEDDRQITSITKVILNESLFNSAFKLLEVA